MRVRFSLLITVALAFVVGGCASYPPSQAGYTLGALAGSILVPGLGGPIGSLAGMLAGLAVEKQVDKANEGKERVVLNKQLGTETQQQPTDATAGELTRVWVDETIQNGREIEGHFEAKALPSA